MMECGNNSKARGIKAFSPLPYSAGLKAYMTSYTAKSLSVYRKACGEHGYAAVNRFGILRNDHDIFQTFEGDNIVLLYQIVGRAGEDHLRDPEFQLDAFSMHSGLLHSVAVRLRKHSKTLGSFESWNRRLNHLLILAETHLEFVILARFKEIVSSCKDRNARAVLKLLCDLYALERIWKDIGSYMNVDDVAPNNAKAILRLTEYLSFEVRNIARELVDAFGIPDFVLRAPLGMQSVSFCSRDYNCDYSFYQSKYENTLFSFICHTNFFNSVLHRQRE